jgi:2-dehydro-3-deoxyglucarate aldolase
LLAGVEVPAMATNDGLRDRLTAGDRLLGARAKTHDPVIVEVYGGMGFDFVWLDFEHGGASPHDTEHLAALARTCETAGIAPLVRLPEGDPPLVRKALDAGLDTVLIPRVETAGEARRAVAASRFRYDDAPGDRGHAGVRANDYGADADGYDERADARTLVGVQIESERAVDNLDAVLSVPGLGLVFVGYGDLAVSMGHPMEPDHPDVQATVAEVREACLDAGVPVGFTVSTTEAAEAALGEGYRLVRIGDEVSAIRQHLGSRLDALR